MPLALLEHVNLNVLDREQALAFYVTGLGGVLNPNTTNDRQLHVNVGASQFHLLLKSSFASGVQPVSAAQVWAGHMELWSREELEAIQQRLTSLGFSWNREEASPASGGRPHLLCSCPWGNRYIVRTAPTSFNHAAQGSHPGGSGTLVALTRCVQLVRPGAAARLHAFWEMALGAVSELVQNKRPDGSTHSHCVVRFSSGQQLIFDERDDAPPADAYDCEERSAYHLAIYVDHMDAYRTAFSACEAIGCLYANPRFAAAPPEFGNAMEWEKVQACGQFRIKDMGVTPEAADADRAALVLEVEVRSVMHRSCPLSRKDIAAGGGELAVPSAFANCSPLKPPPHEKPGIIRIPHGRGGFGQPARELAEKHADKAGGGAAGASSSQPR